MTPDLINQCASIAMYASVATLALIVLATAALVLFYGICRAFK